jgi:hypothetical protein
MAETANDIEQQINAMIAARFAHQPGDDERTDAQDETGERRIIDVDLYHLEGGAVLLVPNNGTNPLDTNAVESERHTLQDQAAPDSETPTLLLVVDEQRKEEPVQEQEPEPPPTGKQRPVRCSSMLVPFVLLCLLAAGEQVTCFSCH